MSFNVENLGFSKGEALPGALLQPPPLFPVSSLIIAQSHMYGTFISFNGCPLLLPFTLNLKYITRTTY